MYGQTSNHADECQTNRAMTASIGGTAIHRAATQTDESIARLRLSVEGVHGLLNNLEQRLDYVLRPVPPEPVDGAKETEPKTGVPLLNELNNASASAEIAQARITALLQRLVL